MKCVMEYNDILLEAKTIVYPPVEVEPGVFEITEDSEEQIRDFSFYLSDVKRFFSVPLVLRAENKVYECVTIIFNDDSEYLVYINPKGFAQHMKNFCNLAGILHTDSKTYKELKKNETR